MDAPSKLWTTIDRVLHTLEKVTVLSLLAAILTLASTQVVARWFGSGWSWVDELVRYLVFWLGVFAAAPATRARKHIAIDAALKLLPGASVAWIRRLTDLLGATVAGILCWATLRYIDFLGPEQLPTLRVSAAAMTRPVALAFGWISVRFLLAAIFAPEPEVACTPTEGAPREGVTT